jgi:hypothetical protein
MGREDRFVFIKLTCFPDRVVSLAQKIVVNEPDPGLQDDDCDCASGSLWQSTIFPSTSITSIGGC